MARGYLAQAEAKDLFQSIAGSGPGTLDPARLG